MHVRPGEHFRSLLCATSGRMRCEPGRLAVRRKFSWMPRPGPSPWGKGTGETVSGKNGRIVTDGPFAESKEAIGGYVLLQVDHFDEALAIAKSCPGLDYGDLIEIQPALDECPIFRRVKERLGLLSV